MPNNLSNSTLNWSSPPWNSTEVGSALQDFGSAATEFLKALNRLIKALVVPVMVSAGVPAWAANAIVDVLGGLVLIWLVHRATGRAKLILFILLVWFVGGAMAYWRGWGAGG